MYLKAFSTGVAAVLLFLSSCGNKPNTVEPGAEQPTAVATESSKEFKVDVAASSLKWKGTKLGGEHFGTINIQSGAINLENDVIKAGSFMVDMNSIVVDDIKEEEYNTKLKNHLASPDFFNIASFPTSKFEITSAEKLAAADDKGNNYTISGNLTIKDISKNISIPAKVDIQEGSFYAVAVFSIDRTEWDIKYNSGKFFKNLGDKLINDAIEFELDLKAKP